MNTTASISPVRRDIKFNVDPEKVLSWHPNNPFMVYLLNVASITFPDGERFFIDAVRAHLDVAKDKPELEKDIRAFIGQEAMHGREHEIYNEYYENKVGSLFTHQLRFNMWIIQRIKKNLPKRYWLLATVALEHLTAIGGATLLENQEIIEEADEAYKGIWMWHALEETEHKAVAFDVYQEAYGKDDNFSAYISRCVALLVMTTLYFIEIIPFFLALAFKQKKLFSFTAWKTFGKIVLRIMGKDLIPDWLDWFKRGFHPWEHDNIIKLKEFEDYLGGVPSPFTMKVDASNHEAKPV
ncbi:MAG: metal-dependent hydrolase [Pseudomonadota bacterium]|nr:metal-dependent hydrolase [Pseudomonadota bacterium]